jgi:hypothetical protein
MKRRDVLGILGMAMAGGVVLDAQRGGGGGGRANIPPELLTPVNSTPPGVREKFAGAYKLIAYTAHGDQPSGRIQYDRAGQMFAMLLPAGRKPLPEHPTADDYREMTRGVVAYYGGYDVDEATHRVVHHVQAGSNPAWIGTDFFRWYELDGNRLTLRTSPNSTAPLVWEKMPER